MASCGRCGTQESLCSSSCTLNVGKCIEPPDAECYPGSQTFLPGVSCATGGRWGTCQTNCTWGALGPCTVLDGGPLAPNSLVIPATVGTKASKTFTMPAANPIPVVDGENSSSPDACLLLSTATSYDYVQLMNNSAKTATVSVWHSQATGGPAFPGGTIVVSYTSFLPPAAGDTDGRGMCDSYGNGPCSDTMTDPTACKGLWAGIMIGDGSALTVPPHSWIWLYNAAQVAGQSGSYQLSVITNSLQ
jgi:hypothetical protein